jgi:site-specific recombinase XerD
MNFNSGWGINKWGIKKMLIRMEKSTGIKCNPHVFRRAFACNLHKKGLSTLSIMHLGGWATLDMVLRYTKSITFDDCLKLYEQANNGEVK